MDLLEAYRQTNYEVDDWETPIKIGSSSPEADIFLLKNNLTEWAFITAYNPMSVPTSDATNRANNQKLKADLYHYLILDGRGVDPAGIWQGEESYFIAGISLDEATEMAKKYHQKAFVFGRVGEEAELVVVE